MASEVFIKGETVRVGDMVQTPLGPQRVFVLSGSGATTFAAKDGATLTWRWDYVDVEPMPMHGPVPIASVGAVIWDGDGPVGSVGESVVVAVSATHLIRMSAQDARNMAASLAETADFAENGFDEVLASTAFGVSRGTK